MNDRRRRTQSEDNKSHGLPVLMSLKAMACIVFDVITVDYWANAVIEIK